VLHDWILLESTLLVLRWVWLRLKPHAHRAGVISDRGEATDGTESEAEPDLKLFPLRTSHADGPDGCGWFDMAGRRPKLLHVRRGLAAQVDCDPMRRERICLTTLRFERSSKQALLPLTASEFSEAINAMLQAIVANGLSPSLVLIEPEEQKLCDFWSRWLEQAKPQLGPHQREHMTAFAWELIQVLSFLDQRPFGLELSKRLAASLRSHPAGMFYGHAYYCGHGLCIKAGRYTLEVNDDYEAVPLATWSDEQSFIDAVAGWSDYVCSGAAPDAPLFEAESEFHLANQRITRARIEEFVAKYAPRPERY
jgi:hypothetical protein